MDEKNETESPQPTESLQPTFIVPSWLLERNVKLVGQTSLSDYNPCNNNSGDFNSPGYVNATPTVVKGSNDGNCGCECAATPEIYAELVDMTKQALHQGNQSAEQYSRHPSILLQSPVEGCLCFMQSTLDDLARDVGADLISLGVEDIIDLSLDLSYQSNTSSLQDDSFNKLPSHFFGFKRSCKDEIETARVRQATSLVIDSAVTKRKSENLHLENDPSQDGAVTQMTILHIHDGKGFLGLLHGSKILKSFRTQVQERREKKERILLLVTTYSDEPVWDLEYPAQRRSTLHRKIMVDEVSIIDMTPASNRDISKRDQSGCTLNTNLRHFKRAIRQRFPIAAENPLLSIDWEFSFVARMSKELKDSLISDIIFARAAQQIAQRAQEKATIGADDICEVMLRILNNKKLTGRYGKLQLTEDSIFNEKLEQLGDICNDKEKKLLSCLVNPSKLNDSKS
jgi:hypothetical protein